MKNNLAVKTRTAISALAFALGLWAVTVCAQSNLVANGSFEAGPAGQGQFTDWWWTGPADNFSNYGVAQSSTPPHMAEQGSYFAYFRGHPTDSSQDCLGTTVNLKVGGLYEISYYIGTEGSTLNTGAAMWAVIGPSFGIDPSDLMLTAYFPNSSNALPYQKFSTIYLATNTAPILSFHGINATNGLNVTNGILLDNVSMTLTYPPLSLNDSPPNSLHFTWPLTNSPYRLQSKPSLTATNWVTLTNVPVNAGTNNQIVLAPSTNMQFFRLTLP